MKKFKRKALESSQLRVLEDEELLLVSGGTIVVNGNREDDDEEEEDEDWEDDWEDEDEDQDDEENEENQGDEDSGPDLEPIPIADGLNELGLGQVAEAIFDVLVEIYNLDENAEVPIDELRDMILDAMENAPDFSEQFTLEYDAEEDQFYITMENT